MNFSLPETSFNVTTCDMHTAGEPLRIIVSGYPPLEGETLLEKRDYAMRNLDNYRKILMFEPRGHFDMYGAIITPPDKPDQADFAVLFIQNEGYSPMCGHAVIALARYAVDAGLVKSNKEDKQVEVRIQCPCGIVRANVDQNEGKTGKVNFFSVPAFVHYQDLNVKVPDFGTIKVDIAFGGAFYAICPAQRVSLNVESSPVSSLVKAATAISYAVKKQIPINHPHHPELSYLYGTILTDGGFGLKNKPTTNICVFADSEVDRSPTGSGVTARMALMHKRKEVKKGDVCQFKSVVDSLMTGSVVKESVYGDIPSVVVQVSGEAYYTGKHQFILEKGDPFSEGFLLRP